MRAVAIPFATGVAALVPAWALATMLRDWASGRSPGWLPVIALVAAALWLRAVPVVRPARLGYLAGLAVGVMVIGMAINPAVLVLLAVLAGVPLANRPPAIPELPPEAAEEGRRVRRLFRLTTSASHAGETRVHDLGPRLLDAHARASEVVAAARTAIARHELYGQLLRGLAAAGIVLGLVLATLWWIAADGAALLAAAWAAGVVARHAYG